MSDDIRERLSALVDGELTEHEAVGMLDRLNHDVELKQVWERYHLVSDVMRNNLPRVTSVDLVGQVRESLDAEPTTVVPMRRRRIDLKPVAGFALAASIAMVAVLAFRGQMGAEGPEREAIAGNAGVPAGPTELAGMRWNVDRPDVEQRLNAYLVNHNGHTGNGMGNMLPYVRIVAYNGGR